MKLRLPCIIASRASALRPRSLPLLCLSSVMASLCGPGSAKAQVVSGPPDASVIPNITNATGVISAKLAPYNAKGDGTTNDTAALQSAINAVEAAGGGELLLTPGTYKVSNQGGGYALLVNTSKVTLKCAKGAATIANASATGDTLLVKNTSGGVDDFVCEGVKFAPSVTRTAGAELDYYGGSRIRVRDCSFYNAYRAIWLGSGNTGTVFGWLDHLYGEDCVGFLRMTYCVDVWVNGLSANTPTITAPTDAITLESGTASCDFVNLDVVGPGAYGHAGTGNALYIVGGASTADAHPNYCHFTNCYFDSYAIGLNATGYSSLMSLDNCWFSCRPYYGVALGANTSHYSFGNCTAFNCGNYGYVISGSDHSLNQCRAVANATIGAANGFYLTAATGVQVLGCRADNGSGTAISGAQLYGLQVGSGCDYINVSNNDFRGNSTGGILLDATPAHYTASGNF